MTVRSSDQISIVDVTDSYSVTLTNEAHTFPGSTSAAKSGSTTTQILAMQGANTVACSVVISEVSKPSGVTVSVDTNKTSPTLTISVDTSVKTGGVISIPVHIGDITITKQFSFAIAYTGATGAAGKNGTNGTNGSAGKNGADAISLVIVSSNGTIFKNTAISTTLTAHVYKGGVEISGSTLSALGKLNWYKDGSTTVAATGNSLVIGAGDVKDKATYVCKLEA